MKQFDDYQAIVAQAVLGNPANKLNDYTSAHWVSQINWIASKLREEAVSRARAEQDRNSLSRVPD